MPTVLIVDDDAHIRHLVRTTLQLLGPRCTLVEAASGAEALAVLQHQRPEVILVDVVMPGMGGIELVQAIRADPALQSCRIVMLTAQTMAREQGGARTGGADDVIAKPFSPIALLAYIRTHLGISAPGETGASE